MQIKDAQHLIVFIELVYSNMDKYGIFLLTDAQDNEELDPAWVGVTSNQRFWDFFFFGTFRNPPQETLDQFELKKEDLPTYIQVYGQQGLTDNEDN